MVAKTYTVNVGGHLTDLSEPMVMGIVNVTPDSFHTSIDPTATDAPLRIAHQAEQMLADGAAILDIGGCSTRPGSQPATAHDEWERVDMAMQAVRSVDSHCIISVDTFRTEVVRRVTDKYGAVIVNDISGGNDDMYDLTASRGLPYILTFNQPRRSETSIQEQALMFFAKHTQLLRDRGQKDIVLDPGFGFNKSADDNFQLLAHLDTLHILHLPLLVGISHKRMVYETLGTDHTQAANGTTVLNTIALTKGAQLLRVHDVRNAVECVKLVSKLK